LVPPTLWTPSTLHSIALLGYWDCNQHWVPSPTIYVHCCLRRALTTHFKNERRCCRTPCTSVTKWPSTRSNASSRPVHPLPPPPPHASFAFAPGHVPLLKFEFEADQLFMLAHSHMVLRLTSPPFGYLSSAEQLRTRPTSTPSSLVGPPANGHRQSSGTHVIIAQEPRVNPLTIFAVGNIR